MAPDLRFVYASRLFRVDHTRIMKPCDIGDWGAVIRADNTQVGMLSRRALLVGGTAFLGTLSLVGCKKREVDMDTTQGDSQSVSEPVEVSNDATVVGFRYTHMGMYRGPFYSIRQVGDGHVCAETSSPIFWPAMDGLEGYTLSDDGTYGYDSFSTDPMGKDAYYSAVSLTDEDLVEFTNLLADDGVFEWDGFDETWTPPEGLEVTDTGETFDLQVLLSDGTHISAHGVDTAPEGSNRAIADIMDWFEDHADYSRYYPTELPDSQAQRLMIEFLPVFYRPGTSDFKIELTRGTSRWAVLLRDGKGAFLDKGTDIGDYGTVDDPDTLPFDRFLDILRSYDVLSWNHIEHEDSDNDERWIVTAYFENGQMIQINTNDHPDWYDGFRTTVVNEIIAYYNEVKS